MHGICGIYSPKRTRLASASLLADMMSTLGPEGSPARSFVDPRDGIAIGYIREFETPGSAPSPDFAWHEGERAVATMDGFLAEPVSGAAASVVARSLEEDPTFPAGLDGHFALAAWSRPARTLRLARDPLGAKVLYCFRDETTALTLFASELRAVLAHPSVPRRVDREALAGVMTFGYAPAPLCLFEGVRKLLPGETIEIDREGTGRSRRYWSIPPYAPSSSDASALAADARDLVLERFARYVHGRESVGVFLSGGVDSTVALGVLKLLGVKRPRAYSFGLRVGRSRFAEDLDWATRAADAVGVRCRPVVIEGGHDPLPSLADVWRRFDDPVTSPNVHSRYLLAEAARSEGVGLCVGGTTAGSLFGTTSDASLAKIVRKAGDVTPEELFAYRTNRIFRFEEIDDLLVEPPPSPREVALEVLRHYAVAANGEGVGERLTLSKMLLTGTEKSVATQDRSARVAGVDMRQPFRDVALLAFCRTIPVDLKGRTDGGMSKHVLKRAFADVLPSEIAERKQIGYPTYYWSGGELDGLVRRLLSPDAVARTGLFRPEVVERIVAEDREDTRRSAGKRTWALLTLQAWHAIHVEGREI